MSIIIKGMDMPKSCNECRFGYDGKCFAHLPFKRFVYGQDKDCPLIEIDLVRCGECKWYEKPYCRWHQIDNEPTDFCSYGERK